MIVSSKEVSGMTFELFGGEKVVDGGYRIEGRSSSGGGMMRVSVGRMVRLDGV